MNAVPAATEGPPQPPPMKTDALQISRDTTAPGTPVVVPGAARAGAAAAPFKSVLERRQSMFLDATARGDNGEGLTPAELARKTAEDFVASAFVEPLLKQLRETNHAAAPFAPGPAEKQFGGIIDAQVARQIARASRFGLVDEMARRMLNKGLTEAQQKEVKSASEQIGAAAKSQGGLNVTAF